MIAALLAPFACLAQPPSEYEVKAAFLLNFTKFVSWPAAAFEGRGSRFTICIVGDDPFGSTLDSLVEGEAEEGHRIVVRRIEQAPRPRACQMLFVGRTGENVPRLLAGLGPGVLTVGEGESFLRDGGMIAFIVEGRHVRFDINLRAVNRASLNASSRLLAVARSVQR